jgi:hypothetical protein
VGTPPSPPFFGQSIHFKPFNRKVFILKWLTGSAPAALSLESIAYTSSLSQSIDSKSLTEKACITLKRKGNSTMALPRNWDFHLASAPIHQFY